MKTKQLVFTALFMAIVFVLGLWPQLGFIQLGPFVQVTIIHVPVIIGAIFLGKTDTNGFAKTGAKITAELIGVCFT